jgi:predicted metal-dependent HD superfamily phosphohydrolase
MTRYEYSWNRLWRSLGGGSVDERLLAELVRRYSEPQRKYHSLQHLDACLRHFASLRDQATHPDEVELALWFHDAIYEVGQPGNEAKSADWARDALIAAGGSPEAATRVHALVMVTCHDVAPDTRDQEVLLDVDLSILGAPPAGFDAYEVQIRAEYAAVAEDAFRSRRRRILQQFLDRPNIYHTNQFQEKFETQARANLTRSILKLGD